MSSTQEAAFAGLSPDAVVMGKALRDWSIQDIGESTEALFAWKQAVTGVTGLPISDAIGSEFAAEFEGYFGRVAISEHHAALNKSFTKGATLLGYPDAVVLDRVDVPGSDGEQILHLAVIATEEGGRALIGVEDGEWGEYDAMDLQNALSDVKRQEHFLNRAFAKLTSPDGFVYGPVTGNPEEISEPRLTEGLKRGQRWRPAAWREDDERKDDWCATGGTYNALFIVHKSGTDREDEVYSPPVLGSRRMIEAYGNTWVRIE